MTISLAVGATTLALNPDLYWSDENAWFPVEQATKRTITGALIVSAATRVAGRPVTLEGADDSAWLSADAVEQLRNWAAVPGGIMSLTLRGITRNVMFRHQDGSGLEAEPIVQFSDVLGTDWYRVTLRLMEI